ncbi:hypothetical protein NDU88_005429 [Pleurodeles waltl]|uniref:Uncharacterized protein n=1 Tax=Pleurodeles waltl TaxID=8319 RepID=A0AAV7TAY4_PLEWA|nr:hypothetical protein NDU88_005429 [Pleurodeles waltl]
MEKVNKVTQALKILQDEGREDLLRDGVLEQAWVGQSRPERVSSEGLVAAVMACASPTPPQKTFRQKSVSGRKVKSSPECSSVSGVEGSVGLPAHVVQVQRVGASIARRSGASFCQHVVFRGRGAISESAVTGEGRLREGASSVTRMSRRIRKQALLPLETKGKRGETALEERQLGVEKKMEAPTAGTQETVITISDDQGKCRKNKEVC